MKKYYKIIKIFIFLITCLTLFTLTMYFNPVYSMDSAEVINEYDCTEKFYNFADNRITIVITKEATRDFLNYGPRNFSEVNAIYVEDLTAFTVDWVRKQFLGIPTDEIMLVNIYKFQRILSITLLENCIKNVFRSIQILEQRSDVESATPSYNYGNLTTVNSNDPMRSEQWGLDRINIAGAWGISRGINSDVKVGVLDTGVDGSHENLRNRVHQGSPHNLNTTLHRDFTTGAILGTPVLTPTDPSGRASGHGTHVAGVIGAQTNNGLGISGVAWDIRIVSLRVLSNDGSGQFEWIARAINFAASRNIPILNASLGWTGSNRGGVREAIAAYGGLFIAAAGNSGVNNDGNNPMFPASYNLPNIISVGATDSQDRRSNWNGFGNLWGFFGIMEASSNFGNRAVHIFAPGTNILSTFPGNQYRNMSGTSMAAPFVAGVAALILANNINTTTTQLRDAIINSGDIINISTSAGTQSVRRLNANSAVRLAANPPHICLCSSDPNVIQRCCCGDRGISCPNISPWRPWISDKRYYDYNF